MIDKLSLSIHLEIFFINVINKLLKKMNDYDHNIISVYENKMKLLNQINLVYFTKKCITWLLTSVAKMCMKSNTKMGFNYFSCPHEKKGL